MKFFTKESVKSLYDNSYVHGAIRAFLVLAFCSVLGVGANVIKPVVCQIGGQYKMQDALNREIDAMKAEIRDLEEREERFKEDKAYARECVEKLAHENRRAYPGELVFVFDD